MEGVLCMSTNHEFKAQKIKQTLNSAYINVLVKLVKIPNSKSGGTGGSKKSDGQLI
jgi:anaerobic glycerol-3-phosphate dehydrogenase